MFLDTEQLAKSICDFYIENAISQSAPQRIFSLVDFDKEQLSFFLDELKLSREEENEFLSFLINIRVATCFARSSIFTDKDENLVLDIYVTERFLPTSFCYRSAIKLDHCNNSFIIAGFQLESCPTKDLPFAWLSEAELFCEEKYRRNFLFWKNIQNKVLRKKLI